MARKQKHGKQVEELEQQPLEHDYQIESEEIQEEEVTDEVLGEEEEAPKDAVEEDGDDKYMVFSEDKIVGDECVYDKGKMYLIPAASVDRWVKRGGRVLEPHEVEEMSK